VGRLFFALAALAGLGVLRRVVVGVLIGA
jgi:hypothetical protein